MSYDLGPLGCIDPKEMISDAWQATKKAFYIGMGVVGLGIGTVAYWSSNSDDIVKKQTDKVSPISGHKPHSANNQI